MFDFEDSFVMDVERRVRALEGAKASMPGASFPLGGMVGQRVFGGEGGEGGSLALGPIVEHEGAYAQFVGTWAFDEAEGKWTFTKANDVPAILYEKHKIAIREAIASDGSSSATDALSVVDAPKLVKHTPSLWLRLVTTGIFKSFSYTPPGDETGTGGVDAESATISFLGSVAAGAKERILETVVEDANEMTTYEDAAEESEAP